AYATSMGRVLLAGLPENALQEYFAEANLTGVTGYTLTDETELRNELERIRAAGYAIVTEELEVSLATVAVPSWNRAATSFAALNTRVAVTQHAPTDRTDLLPALQAAAAEVSNALSFSPRRS